MKKIYTLLDDNGFVKHSAFFNEGEQPSNAVPELITENFIKARFDFTNRVFYEGATPEEIAEFNKAEVPQNIRSRQLRLALVYSEFSLDNISQAIEQLEEPQKSVAKIEWEYATSFDRDNQLLISLGYMLGLTEEQIDNLFILADTL